jgi:hypothetical protein
MPVDDVEYLQELVRISWYRQGEYVLALGIKKIEVDVISDLRLDKR